MLNVGINLWRTSITHGGPIAPDLPAGFPPDISGTKATIAADFSVNAYWAGGVAKASFAQWLAAIGGTYARASTATYLQGGVVKTATANTPRFPTSLGGTPQGIRLTGAGTNLHLQSSISNSIASYTAIAGPLTANAGVDPSGGSAAASFIPNTSLTPHSFFLNAGVNYVSSTVYTFSVFVKPTGANTYNIMLDPENSLVNYSWFSVAGSGAVLGNTGNAVGSIVALANGWFLLSVTFTHASAGNYNAAFNMSDAAGGRNIAGDGTSGWLVWGMQITASASQLDHIPTTTATVAQAADDHHFPYAQTTFSALVNVIGQQSPVPAIASSMVILGVSGNATIFIYYDAPTVFSTINGAALLSGPAIAGSISNAHKIMAAGSPSGRSITNDGSTPISDSGAFAPSPTTCYLGQFSGGQPSYGNIQQMALWNGIVASTAEMQRLTAPLPTLVIFTGESNSGGYAPNSGGTPGTDSPTSAEMQPRPGIQILNNTTLTFQALQIGVNNLIGHTALSDNATHGWELELANAIDAGRFNQSQLYLLKTGQGGSVIAEWSTGNASGYWSTFLSRLATVQGLLPQFTPVVFYSQGINDFLNGQDTSVGGPWETATVAHLAKIRSTLGVPTVPIIMTKFYSGYNSKLNAAIDDIVAHDSHTFAVPSYDSLLQGDNNHWTYLGYKVMCERMIDAWLATLGAAAAAPTYSPPAGVYASPQTVTLSSGSPRMMYSLTADDPFIKQTYSVPFSVTPPTTVTARAISKGKASGQSSANYDVLVVATAWGDHGTSITLANGNKDASSTTNVWTAARTNTGKATGKWYAEVLLVAANNGAQQTGVGVCDAVTAAGSGMDTTTLTNSFATRDDGFSFNGGTVFTSQLAGAGYGAMNAGSTVMIAVDADAKKAWLGINGTWLISGNPATGANPSVTWTTAPTVYVVCYMYSPAQTSRIVGSSPVFAPPAGFTAWG